MNDTANCFIPARLANGVPVIVISLDDQAGRRHDLVSRGIPKHWLEQYFRAVDLRDAGTEDLQDLAKIAALGGSIGCRVRPAEIGCAMSHRAAAGWLAGSGNPMALVLEDDVIPQTPDWLSQVTATSTALLPHARQGAAFICHLGARHDQADPALKRPITWQGGSPPPGMPELFLHTDPDRSLWRAHAYLISRAAAERGWRAERRIATLADDWCERRRRGWLDEIFFTRPILIGQDEDRPSTIRPANHGEGYTPPPSEGPVFRRFVRAVTDGSVARRARASAAFRVTMAVALLSSRIPYRLSLTDRHIAPACPQDGRPRATQRFFKPGKPVESIEGGAKTRILHVANWYPNSWCDVEGNFVRAQYDLFRQVTQARLVNVQVRTDKAVWLRLRCTAPSDHERGYFILTRFSQTRLQALLTTLLLVAVLLRERAWRYDLLHFHIAWPLLAHAHVWRQIFRLPMVISEHWSAYHFNFYLPADAPGAKRISRVFCHGIAVIAVSRALLHDIRTFSGSAGFADYVIPNAVALQHCTLPRAVNRRPVLFAANHWRPIKDPFPMLEGLARAADAGVDFELVIGGFGNLLEDMEEFVAASPLAHRTRFLGKMTKPEVAAQLGETDGYLFSSHYETFSVACAEALGAGVPIIGPPLAAVAEYADPLDWERVETRNAAGWAQAITRFVARARASDFDRSAISARAAHHFAPASIQQAYLSVVRTELRLTTQSRTVPEGRHPA